MIANAAPAERRQSERVASDIRGVATFPDHSTHPFTIANFSDRGARLRFADTFEPPSGFRVEIEGDKFVLDCEVRHHGGYGVGIRFTDVDGASALYRHYRRLQDSMFGGARGADTAEAAAALATARTTDTPAAPLPSLRILILAIENRWGVARLPHHLAGAGFEVAALCPSANIVCATRDLLRRFVLPTSRSSRRMTPAIVAAMREWQPDLVIPADEQAVVLLHALVAADERHPIAEWTDAMRRCLELSLGPRGQRPAMLFKNRTQDLARALGVRTPAGGEVQSLKAAHAMADRIGYPVVVKQSFGSGGVGVKICADRAEMARAYADLAPPSRSPLGRRQRQWMARDWYPEVGPLCIQKWIDGVPAMYTFSAYEGRILAGFSSIKWQTSTVTGPSTVVELLDNPQMADASRLLAGALGSTGFAAFDYMIERETGHIHLLESNPRPNQVPHLGAQFGVDLCEALITAMRNPAAQPITRHFRSSELVALFPQEWARCNESAAIEDFLHDVPFADPNLFAEMIARTAGSPNTRRRRAVERKRGSAWHLFGAGLDALTARIASRVKGAPA